MPLLKYLLVSLSVITLAGCSTQPDRTTHTYSLADMHRKLTEQFNHCIATRAFRDSPGCYKDQLEAVSRMPPHTGLNSLIKALTRHYQVRTELVAGRITQKQASVQSDVISAEFKVDQEREFSTASIQRSQAATQRSLRALEASRTVTDVPSFTPAIKPNDTTTAPLGLNKGMNCLPANNGSFFCK